MRVRLSLLAGVALLGVAVTFLPAIARDPGEYTITARFAETPGLYAHNAVQILGVRTGRITSVTPHAGYVSVVMRLPNRVRLPADVRAVMMAPNPVSDRTVELTPAYVGGAVFPRGGTIPLARTAVPLELDAVFAGVDELARSLGPNGANAHGDLSSALHALARLADGSGDDARAAITAIANALPALTAHPDRLRELVTGLDRLTSTLAARDATINALYGDLAGATGQLADERETLAAAVTNLRAGLVEVAAFIKANQAALGRSVHGLNTVLAAVMADQKALLTTFDTAALGFENFNNAIDRQAVCAGTAGTCPALFGRLDFTKDAAQIVSRYCGSNILYSLVPVLEYNVRAGGSALDTLCAAEIGLLQGRPGVSGAPATVDLDLTRYLGAK